MKINGVDVPKIDKKPENVVSYTQFSMFQQCPKRWELTYARKLRKDEPSIHALFGTAVHHAIQEWLSARFKGDDYNIIQSFSDRMLYEFDKSVERHGEPFSSPDELVEFHTDGVEILKYLDGRLLRYFNPRKYDFVGYEIPILLAPVESRPNVRLISYLDLVFTEKRSGNHYIRDIKTSTRGWNMYHQSDAIKLAQLILYKYYYSKMFGIDLSKIKTDYLIVRRKIEDTYWGRDRVQEFSPPQTEKSIMKVVGDFEHFIETCFKPNGEPNLDIMYPAIAGTSKRNCRFCEFEGDDSLCPKKDRRVS